MKSGQKFRRSFVNAFNGILYCFKNELNFRIHTSVTVLVILLGHFLHINNTEWVLVMSCCSIVLVLEMLNTCLERVCDLISVEYNSIIKNIKDVAAGAVLLSATASCIIGVFIFIPKLIHIIESIS